MNGWELAYDVFEPMEERRREALCTLGNGYFATRGAAPEADADEVHYPGTYIAGCYNRLRDDVARVAALRDDVAALMSLRQDLGQLAELRSEMGRLRVELTELGLRLREVGRGLVRPCPGGLEVIRPRARRDGQKAQQHGQAEQGT